MTVYSIQWDHVIKINGRDTSVTNVVGNKNDAMKKVRNILMRYPYVIAKLYMGVKPPKNWKLVGNFKYARNRKTDRYRLVKL